LATVVVRGAEQADVRTRGGVALAEEGGRGVPTTIGLRLPDMPSIRRKVQLIRSKFESSGGSFHC